MFATFEDASAKAPALFPDNSKTGGDTAAKPEIWENMDDFKARLVKLGADAKAAGESVKDLDFFKAAFGNIGKNDCGRAVTRSTASRRADVPDHAALAPPKASTRSAQTAIRLAGASRKPDFPLAREWAEKTNIVRKLSRRMRTVTFIAAGILVAALAVVWMLTLPATVPASALPAYTPNVDNGRTMFNAGGCAPATPRPRVSRTRWIVLASAAGSP